MSLLGPRALAALLVVAACAAGRVEGTKEARVFNGFNNEDTGAEGTADGADGADGGEGEGGPDDTALPTGDTGSSDGGEGGEAGEGDGTADGGEGADEGAGDEGTGDGGGDEGSGDTSTPVDTAEEPAPCLGITSISPTEATTDSLTSGEFTIVLTGCATGITV